jgi:hypothetical protein
MPRLVVVDHGDHSFARDFAADVAPLIQAHLTDGQVLAAS